MLQHASLDYSFHLIPSSSATGGGRGKACLFDGIGTMALVHKEEPTNRTLVLEVRPQSIVSDGSMREFASHGRREGWWHLPAEACVGEIGQANLLQAQVYDSCVSNRVLYFVVTNLKFWVFGQFVSACRPRVSPC